MKLFTFVRIQKMINVQLEKLQDTLYREMRDFVNEA